MGKQIGTGSLFADRAHKAFMEYTSRQYGNMKNRIRKKLKNDKAELPFNLQAFRDDILGVMGGKEDGPILCRYCKTHFTIEGIAVDHAKPLSRGGSPDLSNLDYPCRPCNDKKGSLTHIEFAKLVEWLERELPLGRQDVLSRLEKANKLASGARADMAIKNDLRKSGAWGKAQKDRRDAKKAKESGLRPF